MPARWSSDEDATLCDLYADGTPIRVIAQRIARSEDAVTERRRSLGLPARPRSRAWTPQEDALIRAAAEADVPGTAVAARLGRPAEQVRRRRRQLVGARSAGRPYTATDDAAIRDAWTRGGDVDALAAALRRSTGSVRLRATALGLHRPQQRSRWSPAEDAVVRDGYSLGLTCAEIVTELEGRTAAAVSARAAKLGLATYARRWTELDDRRLRRLIADVVPVEHAAHALGRTPEALRARARKLRLDLPPPAQTRRSSARWTTDEDEYLSLHADRNPAALAVHLGRSPEAITQRLRRLGLRDGRHRSPHHPAPRQAGVTPGERVAIARELPAGGPRRRLALLSRLEVEPAVVADVLRAAPG